MNRWGDVPTFDFKAKEHFEIASVAASMDFETAAKTSGARFVMLKGAVARIHRALAQFMIDTHVDENGLTEHMTPVLVRDEAMYGTDKLPKFGDDSYQTTNGWWLIPTSEVTLTYSVAGDVLEEAALPRRMTAHTLCFRSEAGSAGRDTSGMLRQHQFEKVEMVSVTHPDQSDDEQKRMLRCAEDMLERLGVPYRTVILCTGDMGFGARRTFDIEAWLPGQNAYREISSVDHGGFSGAADERTVQTRRWRQTAVRAHVERLRSGRRALPDRGAGKRPAGRWVGQTARRAGPLSGRQDHFGR